MFDPASRPSPFARWATMSPRQRALSVGAMVAILLVVAAVIGSGGAGSPREAGSGGGSTGGASAGKAGSGASSAETGPSATIAGSGSVGASSDAGDDEGGASTGSAKSPSAETADVVGGQNASAAGASIQPKVIRTGSVEVAVAKGRFATAVTGLGELATGVGGFVAASETSQLGDAPRGTVTLRVPAQDFDRVLDRIAELGKVRSATTGSQDVTGEYTDVAARLEALQDEREQIRLVLGRAESIPDILAVRDRLSAVQSELEQLQGRKQVLDDQTTLATITVSVSERGAESTALVGRRDERRGLAGVWHDSADRFGNGARAIVVGFAAMAPWLLLLAVLWLPARWLWRRSQADVVARQ